MFTPEIVMTYIRSDAWCGETDYVERTQHRMWLRDVGGEVTATELIGVSPTLSYW